MPITHLEIEYLTELKKIIDECKKCHGTDMSCECYLPYRLEMQKINANIPLSYRKLTFNDIDEPSLKKSIKKVIDYIDKAKFYRDTGKGLYLHGGSGTAKTSTGCILLMELMKKGYTAYYSDIGDYLDSQFESPTEDEEDLYEVLRTVNFLVLDNMGSEYLDSKGLKKSWIEDLIRFRTDRRLPNILISNLEENVWTSSKARLSSILKEHLLPPIEFKCTDRRIKIREENEKNKK
jgi:DNA replication protein DnaC